MRKYTEEQLKEIAMRYQTRSELKKGNSGAYSRAYNSGILERVCSHMAPLMNRPLTIEKIREEASKYTFRGDFLNGSHPAWHAAYKRGILDEVCSHMKANERWTNEKLADIASKYSKRVDFKYANASAYATAINRGILKDICKHMVSAKRKPYTREELSLEALKYESRVEFELRSPSMYTVALRHGIMDDICGHMVKSRNASASERHLLNKVKEVYPEAKTLKDRRVKIEGRPYIKGFDIDIYVPELKKGIEFDGTYWHSVSVMKSAKSHWPEEDVANYHKIKDDYFRSKGIDIIHVTEREWNMDKESVFIKVFNFLSGDKYGK